MSDQVNAGAVLWVGGAYRRAMYAARPARGEFVTEAGESVPAPPLGAPVSGLSTQPTSRWRRARVSAERTRNVAALLAVKSFRNCPEGGCER